MNRDDVNDNKRGNEEERKATTTMVIKMTLLVVVMKRILKNMPLNVCLNARPQNSGTNSNYCRCSKKAEIGSETCRKGTPASVHRATCVTASVASRLSHVLFVRSLFATAVKFRQLYS